MTATVREDSATRARSKLRPSIESVFEWRRPILLVRRRRPRFVWESWCDAVVVGAAWLFLFGLALFALSAVARPQSAGPPIDPWDAELATPVVRRPSPNAGIEMVP
jgi:hypothetical protein